jgi:outer membrane protein assembly factor BamB
MYRQCPTDENEYTVALDAETADTIWEHSTPSPMTKTASDYGAGPNSTPLVVGMHVFTVGTHLVLKCFDKKSGTVVWEHDLLKDHGVEIPSHGYSTSPISYKNTVILPIVGEPAPKQVAAAYDQASGRLVWTNDTISRKRSNRPAYSSPIMINLRGEDQIVFLTNEQLVGLNPSTGASLWSRELTGGARFKVSTPVFVERDLLFCSGGYNWGASVFRLSAEGDKTTAKELWHNRKLKILHGNAIVIDGNVYGSSGGFGPALFTAVNLETGKTAWQHRGFGRANAVYGGGKLILLDEHGQLALTTVTSEKMTVYSQCKVADGSAWTAPTLVGTTLYVRDRRHIMAFDVGKHTSGEAG